jgi:hypothetical protein
MIRELVITAPSGVGLAAVMLILQSRTWDPLQADHATSLHSKPGEILVHLLIPYVLHQHNTAGEEWRADRRLKGCDVARLLPPEVIIHWKTEEYWLSNRSYRRHFTLHSLHDVHEMDACRADPVSLSACVNSRTVGQILIKFGIDVMPLETTPTIGNTNMAEARTCEVGATLATLYTESWYDVW